MNATNTHRWLSEGAEVLAVLPVDRDGLHCEVAIVGTGYGGAVAAAALAGATPQAGGDPIRVFGLERGQEYLPGSFPARLAETAGHMRLTKQNGDAPMGRREGLFDLRLGNDVNVLLANGLGGGSLINAAVMERPTADAFGPDARGVRHWAADIDLAALEPGYCAASAMLVPTPWTGVRLPKLDSLMKAGKAMHAQESRPAHIAVAGADGTSPAGVAMQHCLACGDCASGCNFEAKHSLDTNYLARARANRARFFCGATVHSVRRNAGAWELVWSFTDPDKAYADTPTFVLHAGRVVLAAGTLGSTEILMRSRTRDLALSGVLGQRFSTNGDMIAAGYLQDDAAHCNADESTPPEKRAVGPTIAGLVRKNVDGQRPLMFQEFAVPAPLRRVLGEVVAGAATLHGLLVTDTSEHRPDELTPDPLAVNDSLYEHTSIYGMMGDDGAGGTLKLTSRVENDCDGKIQVDWAGLRDADVFKAQVAQLRAVHDNGPLGGRAVPNPMWWPVPDTAYLSPRRGPVMTVHPLGGCPMGDDVARGVVDSCGRVFDAANPGATFDGLAVLDGSIIPVSLGINPSFTIAALAERAMPKLMAQWSLQPRAATAAMTDPRPRLRDLRQPQPVVPSVTTVRECLVGDLVIRGKTYQARIEVHFAPIADMQRFLVTVPRRIPLQNVELTLTTAEGKSAKIALSGNAEILCREKSSVWTRNARAIKPVVSRILQGAGNVLNAADPIAGATADDGSVEVAKSFGDLFALCSHFGAVRQLVYSLEVTSIDMLGSAPLQLGDRMQLLKRVEFDGVGNPWRQLSENEVTVSLGRQGHKETRAGRMVLDLDYFILQLTPLLRIQSQPDQPSALADLAALALFTVRVALEIHALDFLRPKTHVPLPQADRLPCAVNGIEPVEIALFDPSMARLPCRLVHYAGRATNETLSPVLMIHGYGASGSTFTHPSIPQTGVATLLQVGREVYVLDLRTSIALDHRQYWSFEEVATGDIPPALCAIRDSRVQRRLNPKIDVLAHCIGAAMFSIAVLADPDLHECVNAAALSQVGPLLRMSPMNRFRGYVCSYIRQYLGTDVFDVTPAGDDDGFMMWLLDGALATFPYPDDDHERDRMRDVPDFARIRHRADAIWGQLMQLDQVSDESLSAFDSLIGWVTVEGLAQTIYFARDQMVSDELGLNRWVAWKPVGERFGFPVLLVHGRHNAVFDWRGSYDSLVLLDKIFSVQPTLPAIPADPGGDLRFGAGTPRRLLVLDNKGHQDSVIGTDAGKTVFQPIADFFEEFEEATPSEPQTTAPISVDLPWLGPVLGWARLLQQGSVLACRLSFEASPMRATSRAVVFVPAQRKGGLWQLDFASAVASDTTQTSFLIDVQLHTAALAGVDGFAVVTVHDDLPSRERKEALVARGVRPGPFASPNAPPAADVQEAVEKKLLGLAADDLETCIVRLTEPWQRAVDLDALAVAERVPFLQHELKFVAASCQFPPGLFDREAVQASYLRLCSRPDAASMQFLVLAGDQVYLDPSAGLFEPTAGEAPALVAEHAYELNLQLPGARQAMRSMPTYMVLDDGEVKPRWEPGRPGDVQPALAAYDRHQRKLMPDAPAQGARDRYTFSPGGVPFFVLDSRSSRQIRVLDERAAKAGTARYDLAQICSVAALEDLKRWLENAPAQSPKFLVTASVVFPFEPALIFGAPEETIALDSWSGFPASLVDLLLFIRDTPVDNVVILSGHAHFSSISTLCMESDSGRVVEVESIVSSGLHAPWPSANKRADQLVLDGPVKIRSGNRVLKASISTPVTCPGDGFAIVSATQEDDMAWTVAVEMDRAHTLTFCTRPLASAVGWGVRVEDRQL